MNNSNYLSFITPDIIKKYEAFSGGNESWLITKNSFILMQQILETIPYLCLYKQQSNKRCQTLCDISIVFLIYDILTETTVIVKEKMFS